MIKLNNEKNIVLTNEETRLKIIKLDDSILFELNKNEGNVFKIDSSNETIYKIFFEFYKSLIVYQNLLTHKVSPVIESDSYIEISCLDENISLKFYEKDEINMWNSIVVSVSSLDPAYVGFLRLYTSLLSLDLENIQLSMEGFSNEPTLKRVRG